MTPRSLALLVLALGFVAVSAPVQAGTLGKLPLAKKATPLLGGHLQARFPAKATSKPRGHSIMAAPNPVEEETRVVVDDGDKRFVIMTYELFATADKGFEKAVRKEVKQFFSSGAAYGVEARKIGNLKRAFVMKPSKLDGTEAANLVLGAYFAHGDGTVQFVAFYANPEAATKDAAGCTALAEKILATYRGGSRKLTLDGGAQKLFAWKNVVHVDVPRGWVITTTPGPDFVVHRGRKLSPFGQPTPSFGIYLGGHPNAQYNQLGSETKRTQTAGKLAGKDTTWHAWKDKSGLLRKEALAAGVAPGDPNLSMHLFMAGPDPADIAMIDAIAATVSVARKP